MKRSSSTMVKIGAASLVLGAFLVPGIVDANARRNAGGSDANQAATERTLTAVLSGAGEVPGPGDLDGRGAATITLDPVGDTVCVDSTTSGIDTVTLTHIHRGAVGVQGPVVLDFVPGGLGSLSKCVLADSAVIDEIAANPAGFYFNVHTTAFGAGAVRGNFAVHAPGAGAAHLLPEPLRAYDSRNLTAFAPAETRTVDLMFGTDGAGASKLAVPPGATGALVTVTVTRTAAAGFLTLYSGALTTAPATSTINWVAGGQDVATTTTVAVDATSKVKITAGPTAANGTDVIVDVIGYYF